MNWITRKFILFSLSTLWFLKHFLSICKIFWIVYQMIHCRILLQRYIFFFFVQIFTWKQMFNLILCYAAKIALSFLILCYAAKIALSFLKCIIKDNSRISERIHQFSIFIINFCILRGQITFHLQFFQFNILSLFSSFLFKYLTK